MLEGVYVSQEDWRISTDNDDRRVLQDLGRFSVASGW